MASGRQHRGLTGLLLAACVAGLAAAGEASHLPTVAEKTAGLETRTGLLTLHLDHQAGQVWLEMPALPAAGQPYLYVEGLTSGLGSNPVGLDRSQLGPTRLVSLRRAGGRLLLQEQNLAFRAQTRNEDERRAVDESFADSVLWAAPLAAEDADGRFLVDFTSFIVSDAHGSARTLDETGQGSFSVDEGRSAVDLESCLVFPDNVEMEAILTLAGSEPGAHVRSTAATAGLVTLRQHHSLLRLPDDDYRPRRFDPRAGSFAISFRDYAAPLDAPLQTSWIVRHRLRRGTPLVYYVDRGVPEPVRSALVEGASWWEKAFAAAGFPGGFRVELLPEGAHPLDVRYNVIQWVHRSTRGWSYGGGVIDPRTGEMIKGHVLLGSLRVRQDRLLFEGLAGTARTGSGAADDPVELALARIRQLSAHEVGHTLGLMHNFAASTYGRASVMDYPAPLVGITAAGDLDFSQAYGVGVGAWDMHAIRYAYTEFAHGADETAALAALVAEGLKQGLLFLTDSDARAPGASQPLASLWDNGADPVDGLQHAMQVRRIALARFDETVIAEGTALALLHEALVPVYLHHRYQLDAAVKVIGGQDYRHALRGDGQPPVRFLSPAWERRALEAVLDTLDPAALDLPEPLLQRLLPRPPGDDGGAELFGSRTAPAFDAVEAAATAAGLAVAGLLQPERAARLEDFNRRDPAQLGLPEVLRALVRRVFERPPLPPRLAALARAVEQVVVDGLISLAADDSAAIAVRARVEAELRGLLVSLERDDGSGSEAGRAHRDWLAAAIRRHLARSGPEQQRPALAPAPPPGSPIGN